MTTKEKTAPSTSTQDPDAVKAALLKRQRERQRATLLKRRQRKSHQ